MERHWLTASILVALLLTGCTSEPIEANRPSETGQLSDVGAGQQNQPATSETSVALDNNRELWLSQDLVCYTAEIRLNRVPEYAGTWQYVVSDGRTIEPQPDPTGGAARIDALFGHIVAGLGRGDVVEAFYDPAFGFPTSFTIGSPDPDSPDGGISGAVLSFEPNVC